jgi:hypothetical protein
LLYEKLINNDRWQMETSPKSHRRELKKQLINIKINLAGNSF